MKIPLILRTGLTALVLVIAPASHATDITPKVAPLGDNTYTVTVKAGNKFTRDTEKLKAKAIDEANAFCARQGRHMKI